MSYYKFDGTLAGDTPASATSIYGTSVGGETLTGTTAPTAIWGEGPNDLLIGKSGSDTFYLQGSPIQVAEVAGGSAEIVTWANASLTNYANIANLQVGGTQTYAAGNGADNLIIANGSTQQLYGGAGQDVLVGDGKADTFVIVKGEGNDAIYNFNPAADTLRITAGYSSFTQLQNHLTQVGADVRIDLGGTDAAIIRNIGLSQLTANNFQLQLDTSKLGLMTFGDEFNSLSLWNGSSGTWATTFWYQSTTGNGGSLNSGEQEWYINSNYSATASVTPWTVANGDLTLTAAPASAAISSLINNYRYTSGEVNTYHSFAQTYGYFEMRAELPHNTGGWPAFWLVPEDGSWPPELDVMETYSDPHAVYTTQHSGVGGVHTSVGSMAFIPDTVDGFHTYGVLWTKAVLTFYVDGVEAFHTATPSDMNKPMYMIANVALGGTAGAVDPSQLPAKMVIDYIHAYGLADGSSVTTLNTAPPPSTPPSGSGPLAPAALADTSIVGGYVNLAHDTSGQTLTGTAAPGLKVVVADGATKLGATVADSTGHWTYTLGQLSDGGHNLTATATDTSGAVSPASAALAFTVDTLPPGAPTSLADSAISHGYVNNAGNVAAQALTGAAEAGSSVTVLDGTVNLGTSLADTTGKWSFSLGHMTDGAHVLSATAMDSAGNLGAASAPLSFTVDTVAPVAPLVSDVVYDPTTRLSTVTGLSEPGSTVSVIDNGKSLGTATAGGNGVWSLVTRVANTGIQSFTETATDPAGNPTASAGVAMFSRGSAITLTGGAGNDVLVGQAGDTLTGGAGHDQFVFNPQFGHETITDFDPLADVIAFDHSLFSSFTSVMQHATQVGTATVITYDLGGAITLQNTTLSGLQSSDFLFL